MDLSILDRIPPWVDGLVSFIIFLALVIASAGPLVSIPVLVILNLLSGWIRSYHNKQKKQAAIISC